MNEENNMNNTTSETNSIPVSAPEAVTPQPVETPAPVETSAQVVTPVQPTVGIQNNNAAPAVELVAATKKSNPIVVILLILVLLGVCGYGLYTYTDIFKSKKSNTGTTTTTTTKAALEGDADGEFPITSFEDYIAIVKNNTKNTSDEDDWSGFELIDLDNRTLRINYDVENNCKNDGDRVSIPVGPTNVEYICNKVVNNDSPDEPITYWDIDVTINNTFKKSRTGWSTCEGYIDFTDGNNVFEFVTSCGMGGTAFTVSKMNNSSLKLEKYEAYLIHEDPSKYDATPAIIKDNTLYFVEADPAQDETVTTCRIKSVDLTANTLTKNDLGFTTDCYYTHGY